MNNADRELFKCKVREELQHAYDHNVPCNFDDEIKEIVRPFHNMIGSDVTYIIVKEILSFPEFDTGINFISILQTILNLSKNAIYYLGMNQDLRTGCLRAIEDCCNQCDHLKSREVMACLIQYFLVADILDRISVLDYHDEMCERGSHLLEEASYKATIARLEAGANAMIGPGRHLYWTDENDTTSPYDFAPPSIIEFVGDTF